MIMKLKNVFEADNHVLLYEMFHVKHYGMFFIMIVSSSDNK